ncbi:hypothetical protein N9N67_07495 [Bacteriovoracaceae bacterium]|nr:hypothetical protein [Bacteriovoracaceae bacterium]
MKIALLSLSLVLLASCSHHKRHGKKKHLDKYDLNKDGKITAKEFQDAHAEKFKKWDKNGDGVLDDSEKNSCK